MHRSGAQASQPEDLNRIREEALAFAGIGLYRYGLDGTLRLADVGALRIFDLLDWFPDPAQVAGRNIADLVVYKGPRGSMHQEVRTLGRVRGRHWEFRTLKGADKLVVEDAYLVRDPDTGDEAIQVIVQDITEHQHAERALADSEEKYRTILHSIQEGYYEVDLDGNMTFFNTAMRRILGYDEDELRGLDYRSYYADDATREKVAETFKGVYRTGHPIQLDDWEVLRKDGSRATLGVSIALMRNASGAPIGFQGVVRDMTEGLSTLHALREAEARYRELFENANDIIYTHDLEGRFTSWNKAGERVTGYACEETLEINVMEILAPEYRALVRDRLNQKKFKNATARYELEIIAKDGRRLPVEVSTRVIFDHGQAVGVQGIARDMSERRQAEAERRRLEAQIQHTQKLEGLGVLAGGIAHDFNNLLVGVMGNAGLAMAKLPPDSPAQLYLQRIETTAQRAAELTNQMLAYSGRGAFVVRPIDLSTLAQEMGPLVGASISKKVTLRYECPAGLPLIEGDVTQLHQVLLNLITNASDAIGDQKGVITVRTGAIEVDRAYLAQACLADPLPEGAYVSLAVSDTGSGMDTETQSRIFDPFYSTKFPGRGLGLATVFGIVRGHKGAIAVASKPGHGSTFTVLLPAKKGVPIIEQPNGQTTAPTQKSWTGSGTILVADDEPGVLDVVEATFEWRGFTVLTALDGRTAVEIFKAHHTEVVAVLLDLTMPVLSGSEAFEAIRRIRPDVPVILSSGYTQQDVSEHFEGTYPNAFLQKPYRPKELIQVVRSVLEPAG
jgi:PAS domain S-box-containing protein